MRPKTRKKSLGCLGNNVDKIIAKQDTNEGSAGRTQYDKKISHQIPVQVSYGMSD